MSAYRVDLEKLLLAQARTDGCCCPLPQFYIFDAATDEPLRPDVDCSERLLYGRVVHDPGCPADS